MTAPFADKVHTDHEITSVKASNGRFVIGDATADATKPTRSSLPAMRPPC